MISLCLWRLLSFDTLTVTSFVCVNASNFYCVRKFHYTHGHFFFFYKSAIMEQEHRTKILSKIDRLVNYTKFDILVRACLYHKLLSEETVDNIQVRMNKNLTVFFSQVN